MSSSTPARPFAAEAQFGCWAAAGTALTTLVAFGTAIATPPLSGPLCRERCISYPYLDIAARFPRDYYWMFPAMCAALLYVAFMLAVHARARPGRRLVAQFSLALSVMAALIIIGDYFLQLAVIQPSLLAGETDGISLLTQYNPHGVFIALEELGYLLMSASLACMAPALSSATRLERAVRWLFVGGSIACVAALIWFLAEYGHARGYLLEVSLVTIAWVTLIPGALMMAAIFRRDLVLARRRAA
jgi:hypothetical protein